MPKPGCSHLSKGRVQLFLLLEADRAELPEVTVLVLEIRETKGPRLKTALGCSSMTGVQQQHTLHRSQSGFGCRPKQCNGFVESLELILKSGLAILRLAIDPKDVDDGRAHCLLPSFPDWHVLVHREGIQREFRDLLNQREFFCVLPDWRNLNFAQTPMAAFGRRCCCSISRKPLVRLAAHDPLNHVFRLRSHDDEVESIGNIVFCLLDV
mmetsp:Transcript_266/g.581  ORF Transcript_266/g.581 Transcript_266/m.581 type:complete len:210 (+) Transcript_266:656-1285(+)